MIPVPGLGTVVGGVAGQVIDTAQGYAVGQLIGWGGDTLEGGFGDTHAALVEDLAANKNPSLQAVRLQTAQFVWRLEHDTPDGPLADVPDPTGMSGSELQSWYDEHLDDLLEALDEERGGSTFDSLARAYRDGSGDAEGDNDPGEG